MTRARHMIAWAALALAAAAPGALAGGPYHWEEVYPGVDLLLYTGKSTDGPVKFFVARADLAHPAVEVVVSPPKYKGARTSAFAKAIHAKVAINGGFWTVLSHQPKGLLVSGGRKWPHTEDDGDYGFLAVTKEGKAWVSPPEEVATPDENEGYMVISGRPQVVRAGKVPEIKRCGYICMKHPRAAAGTDETGTKLYMAVADGRQEGSASITLATLGEFLVDIGVWDAINLDGGGSATLYVEKKGGVVNTPCEGRERSVVDHLALIVNEAAAAVPPSPPPPVEAAVAAGPPAQEGEAAAAKAAQTKVAFTDKDFVENDELEMAPTVKRVIAGASAGGALLLIAAGAALFLAVRKKRRKKT